MTAALRFLLFISFLIAGHKAQSCEFDAGNQAMIDSYNQLCTNSYQGIPRLENDPSYPHIYTLMCFPAGQDWSVYRVLFVATCPTTTPSASSGGAGGSSGSGGGPGAGGGGSSSGGGGSGSGSGGTGCRNACCPGSSAGSGVGGPGGSLEGSIIQVDNQSVGERIPIVGTSFTLNYTSSRALGRTNELKKTVEFLPPTPDSEFDSRSVTVEVAGRSFPFTCTVASPCSSEFTWDGLDNSSHRVMGSAAMVIRSIDTHNPVHPNEVENVVTTHIGTFFAITAKLGGWTLSPHHFYDVNQRIVFLGDGTYYSADSVTVSGGGYLVASESGNEVYVFNSAGVHQSTKTAVKGATKYTFTYSSGRLVSITDAYANVTTINYDMSGQPASIVGAYGQSTALTVDGDGNINSVTNPNSEVYSMTYYSGTGGLLHTFAKPNGVTSTMTYGTGGLLTSDVSSAGSSVSLTRTGSTSAFAILAETAEGIQSTYAVTNSSPTNYSRSNTGPGAVSSSYTTSHLPSGGRSDAIHVDPTGIASSSNYAVDPRLPMSRYLNYQSIATPNSLLRSVSVNRAATLSDPNDIFSVIDLTETSVLNSTKTTTTVYSAATSKYTTTSPVGRKTYVTIDANERVSSEQFATFTPVAYTYDTHGRLSTISQSAPRITTFAYNTAGFLSSVTNALSQATSYTYDSAGRILSQTLPDSRVIWFSYDANGNVASVTPPGGSAHGILSNGFDVIAKYTAPATSFFESADVAKHAFMKAEMAIRVFVRKIADWIAGFFPTAATELRTFVINRDTDYVYNNDRQLTSVTRPDGQVITYSYSGTTGRLDGITVPSGSYSFTQNTYYPVIDQSTSPDSVVQDYTYDGPLLISATTSGAATGAAYFTYNNEFQMASTRIGTASAINRTYDNDGLLTAVGNQTITRNTTTGLATKATLSNVSENYTYSTAFGELATTQGKYSTSTNVYLESVTRDNLGRVYQKVETVGSGSANTYVYTFDPAGRLTTVTKNGSALSSYTYDSNSNRTSQTISGVTKTATYDEQDRLRTWGTKTYTYNDAGELTQVSDSSTSPASITTYTYDAFGNMKSVTLPSGAQIAYLLDGENRRVVKKVGGTVQKQFVWFDGTRIGAELNSAGAIVAQFIYGLKGNTPDYIIKGTTKYKVMTDHLGSVVAVVNSSNGTVSQKLEYDEFGRVLVDTSPGFQPFGFAGGLYDPDIKLTLFGARSYDAEVGRWVSKDPIRFSGGDTNLYGYVLNDPVNFTDPLGLFVSAIIDGGATIGGGAGAGAGMAIGAITSQLICNKNEDKIGACPEGYEAAKQNCYNTTKPNSDARFSCFADAHARCVMGK